MSPDSVRCVKAAFAFFAIGAGLGLAFAFDRSLGIALRPLHAELNLWGWVTLLTYGFAHHMIPRFAGREVRWPRAVRAQTWMAIAGVSVVVGGWILGLLAPAAGDVAVMAGALVQLAAAGLFALLMGELLRDRHQTPG